MQNKIHNAWHPIASYQICKKAGKDDPKKEKKKTNQQAQK